MAVNKKRAVVSKMLREMLGEPVDVSQMSPEEIKQLAEGHQVMTYGEAITRKLTQLAAQGKEWAVAIVLERTEGKAVQATKEDGSDRTTEERLNNITTKHLNSLSSAFIAPPEPASSPAADSVAEDGADRPASRLLGLSKNRAIRSQEATGEPPVASKAT